MIFLPLCVLAVAGMRLARPKAGPAEVCAVAHEAERPADSVRLFRFDPNTIDYAGLRQLGLTAYEAASLLKYRAAGKVFPHPGGCGYLLRLHRLALLPPGTLYPHRPQVCRRAARLPLRNGWCVSRSPPRRSSSTRCRRSTCGPSGRCRSARPRPSCAGATCTESATWRSCANAMSCRTRWLRRSNPMSVFAVRHDPAVERVELNRADSAALCSVVRHRREERRAILRYRERLGGFRCVEQLAEVRGGHGAQLRVDCETNLVRQL